jgi:hypothetical protein
MSNECNESSTYNNVLDTYRGKLKSYLIQYYSKMISQVDINSHEMIFTNDSERKKIICINTEIVGKIEEKLTSSLHAIDEYVRQAKKNIYEVNQDSFIKAAVQSMIIYLSSPRLAYPGLFIEFKRFLTEYEIEILSILILNRFLNTWNYIRDINLSPVRISYYYIFVYN